jgi:hypothetical protein
VAPPPEARDRTYAGRGRRVPCRRRIPLRSSTGSRDPDQGMQEYQPRCVPPVGRVLGRGAGAGGNRPVDQQPVRALPVLGQGRVGGLGEGPVVRPGPFAPSPADICCHERAGGHTARSIARLAPGRSGSGGLWPPPGRMATTASIGPAMTRPGGARWSRPNQDEPEPVAGDAVPSQPSRGL